MKVRPVHICLSLLLLVLLLCPDRGLTSPQNPSIPDLEAALLEALLMEPMARTEMMELGRRSLSLMKHSMERVNYKREDAEDMGEGGIKRNEALNSIAGGLQAFNRQKGGFGFRFGRK